MQDGMQAWQKMATTGMDISRELAGKWMSNLEANVDDAFVAGQAIMSAKTYPEAMRLYADFLQEQMRAVTAQNHEIVSLLAKHGWQGVTDAQIFSASAADRGRRVS
jgi:hypothetical protein